MLRHTYQAQETCQGATPWGPFQLTHDGCTSGAPRPHKHTARRLAAPSDVRGKSSSAWCTHLGFQMFSAQPMRRAMWGSYAAAFLRQEASPPLRLCSKPYKHLAADCGRRERMTGSASIQAAQYAAGAARSAHSADCKPSPP